MKSIDGLGTHPSLLITAVVVLLAAHGMVFYRFRHLALSAVLASGLLILIVFKHQALFTSALAMFRKRFTSRERWDRTRGEGGTAP